LCAGEDIFSDEKIVCIKFEEKLSRSLVENEYNIVVSLFGSDVLISTKKIKAYLSFLTSLILIFTSFSFN
jgi:hypothetical protein